MRGKTNTGSIELTKREAQDLNRELRAIARSKKEIDWDLEVDYPTTVKFIKLLKEVFSTVNDRGTRGLILDGGEDF